MGQPPGSPLRFVVIGVAAAWAGTFAPWDRAQMTRRFLLRSSIRGAATALAGFRSPSISWHNILCTRAQRLGRASPADLVRRAGRQTPSADPRPAGRRQAGPRQAMVPITGPVGPAHRRPQYGRARARDSVRQRQVGRTVNGGRPAVRPPTTAPRTDRPATERERTAAGRAASASRLPVSPRILARQ